MTLYAHASDKTCPAALVGEDFPGLRPKLAVQEGDIVAAGQTLFHDAKRPAIAFASPIAGRVTAIHLGPRRTLSAISLDPVAADPPPPSDRLNGGSALRAYLLARGAWPDFVARPYGGPPDPDARPDAIVVSAVRSSREGFFPREVLIGREAEFARGLQALTALTDGTVHLCLNHGAVLAGPAHARIKLHKLRWARAWQTPGGQVAQVHPAGAGQQVWTIGCQAVTAIGHLLETGTYDPIRTITIRGGKAGVAKVERLPLGAHLPQVFNTSELNCHSGTVRNGRPARYLGRHHDEAGLITARPLPIRNAPQALIPFTALNSTLPARVPAVALMRALSTGDLGACAKLGCLELLEEDVAPLSTICTSGMDYGSCLRGVLDQLRKDAA